MPKFLNNILLEQNSLQRAVIHPLGTAPDSGSEVEGQIQQQAYDQYSIMNPNERQKELTKSFMKDKK